MRQAAAKAKQGDAKVLAKKEKELKDMTAAAKSPLEVRSLFRSLVILCAARYKMPDLTLVLDGKALGADLKKANLSADNLTQWATLQPPPKPKGKPSPEFIAAMKAAGDKQSAFLKELEKAR